ncbi:MAG: ABC transporter permease [Isosphaeraceae bacterium]|jgi:phospholipid/cholesterol/gamma-HCH transport system permease protein|nr:MAG: ABC transporter permease [Isosphaeraceae bacterium]
MVVVSSQTPRAAASRPAPPAPPLEPAGPTNPVQRLGEYVFDAVAGIGGMAVFTIQTFGWMFRRPPRWGVIVPSLYNIGVLSMPVVALTGTFIGMVLAIQTYTQFESMQMETKLGGVINIALVKELGPVLAATMLAGRVGSSMAAELGTMRVTEQIDALIALGTNPIRYLVVPRFLACVLLIPLLTLMADFMGVIGGAFVCTQLLGVDSYHYWMHSRASVTYLDLFIGIFKSIFFGAAIALIGCHRGFHSAAGAEGVGRAATESFVLTFIAILAIDFVLGWCWNIIYFSLYPVERGFF